MGINVTLLKSRIAGANMSVEQLASAAGMDRTTLYRKLKADGVKFTVGEMQKIIRVLALSDDEAKHIFFAQPVA